MSEMESVCKLAQHTCRYGRYKLMLSYVFART